MSTIKVGSTIQDHEGNDVQIVWCSRPGDLKRFPSFAFQVYLTPKASGTSGDETFPIEFAKALGDLSVCPYHLQIYTKPLPNVLACVEHQRKEIQHRNGNGIVPHMVRSWVMDSTHGHAGFIMVVQSLLRPIEATTVVRFDPKEYENPYRFEAWNEAGIGDLDVVNAVEYPLTRELTRLMVNYRNEAGHEWTEQDLERRNEGGFSPALYPAVDPTAHYDAEHDIHELDGTALPGPAIQQNADDDEGMPKISDMFDRKELFKQNGEFDRLKRITYDDNFGLPVTSVWDTEKSKTRPFFSFTLYLGFDLLPLHSSAIFACLNKGLLSNEPWTLDIVRNLPSVDTALEYHTRSSVRRAMPNFEPKRKCAFMLVQKIMNSKLPGEILDLIVDFLVPPVIPDYSCGTVRPLKNVFMYLDQTHSLTGPLLVYSNPATSTAPDTVGRSGDPKASSKLATLRVINLRYWHRVADELHILWSLCNPRSAREDHVRPPTVSLRIKMPKMGIQEDVRVEPPEVDLCTDSDRPVTIHMGRFSAGEFWDSVIEVVDLSSYSTIDIPKEVHEDPPSWVREDMPYCNESWALTPELGFSREWRDQVLLELPPGESRSHRFLHLPPYWWQTHFALEKFKDGGHYALKLQEGFTISKWRYGTRDEVDGAFNTAPMPVRLEGELQFEFNELSFGN